jgi:hypothetical protein
MLVVQFVIAALVLPQQGPDVQAGNRRFLHFSIQQHKEVRLGFVTAVLTLPTVWQEAVTKRTFFFSVEPGDVCLTSTRGHFIKQAQNQLKFSP